MSLRKKPRVVVTRRLPDSVETRMRELFDAQLNLTDEKMSQEALIEAVKTADVLALKRDRLAKQRAAFDELRRLEDELEQS